MRVLWLGLIFQYMSAAENARHFWNRMIATSDASYLLRFDDICPTMKWSTWEPIELILREHDLKPIMAVVPDNHDPELYLERANPNFWDRVRSWQAAGWTVGLHGFQHTYVTRHPGLYSHRKASEFAGLSPFAQREKLARALAILRSEGVHSSLWAAPGHSFDRTTVLILGELGVTSISDGFTISPYTDEQGTFWIPQQLSEKQMLSSPGRKPSEPKSKGVWTFCFHPNAWTDEDIVCFRREVGRYRSLIRSVGEVHALYFGRQMDWLDRIQIAKFEVRRQLRLLGFAYSMAKNPKVADGPNAANGVIEHGVAEHGVAEMEPVRIATRQEKDQ